MKRNAREHIDAEYNSHVIVERRHSLCRNKYCYTCEHVYSDRHSHSYNEYFRRDPHDLKHDIDDCYCEFPKRMVRLQFAAAFFIFSIWSFLS